MNFLHQLTSHASALRRSKDRGFILISTMLIFVLVSGTVYALLASTSRTITSSTATRDFGQSGQRADQAIQDAIFELNESNRTTPPRIGSPRTSTEDLDNDGAKDWSWYIDAPTTAGSPMSTIHAQGTSRGTTRKVSAMVGTLTVGGYLDNGTDQLGYELSPESAFSHVVLGRNVTIQNGSGMGAGSTFVEGIVGSMATKPIMTPAAGTTSKSAANYHLYGSQASTVSIAPATRIPAAVKLDTRFITDSTSMCLGAEPRAWVASQNNGRLTANNTTKCYSSMNFDVPTVVLGSGAANLFTTGAVTVSATISAPPTAGINLYTTGGVNFDVEKSAGTSLSVNNMFVYAPNGTCKTTVTGKPAEFRSMTHRLDFTGSLACDTVKVAGKFTGATAIKPLGSGSSDIYGSKIWYVADYQQPSGVRE